MLRRRKEFQRQLRLQDKEVKAAREAVARVRDALQAEEASQKLRHADLPSKKNGNDAVEKGRFVRAAGAVKALRAKTFGEESEAGTFASGSRWRARLTKNKTNRIKGGDAGFKGDFCTDIKEQIRGEVRGGGGKKNTGHRRRVKAQLFSSNGKCCFLKSSQTSSVAQSRPRIYTLS